MTDLTVFTNHSPLHIVTLIGCLLITVAVTVASRRSRACCPRVATGIRYGIVVGCLLSWIVCTVYLLLPHKFDWEKSLPLQFCNMANLIGALAVGREKRWSIALAYYWALTMCIWAFVTPTLNEGPALFDFWIFWIYHLFILITFAHVVWIDRFRPTWKDFGRSYLLTLAYMGFLITFNAFTGWNYGFVGPAKPDTMTPIDVLGPYPLRLVWMALIGAGLFALVTLISKAVQRKPAEPAAS